MRALAIAALTLAAACAGLTSPSDPPRVVSTIPAEGAVLSAGEQELRVTFSEPMADGRWSYVIAAEVPFPELVGSPRLLEDRRTFAVTMRLQPATRYAVQFNSQNHTNFRSVEGEIAEIHVLRFSTAPAPQVSQ